MRISGWGAVAPRLPNVHAFQANLETATSWLEPFEDFGPLSSNADWSKALTAEVVRTTDWGFAFRSAARKGILSRRALDAGRRGCLFA